MQNRKGPGPTHPSPAKCRFPWQHGNGRRPLSNMDQTPLSFVMDHGKTDEVWFASGSSGLDKRQCTVQLTIFADGKTLMPLISFN